MNGPLTYAASAGIYRAQVIDKVVTGLTAGASVVVRGVGGTADILPAVAVALAEAGQRVLEVRPPLDGAAFIGQLAAGWRSSVGGPAMPPATSAETFVLLVHEAEQMPPETVRHLERLAQAWPGMRIVLGGAPSTASAISAGLYPTLNDRLSVFVQLAAAADLRSPLDRDYDWATVSATGLPASAIVPRPAVLAAPKPRRRLNPVGATAAGGFLAALALTVAIGPRLVGAQAVRGTALPPGPQAEPTAMAETRVVPAPAAVLAGDMAPVSNPSLETPVILDVAFTAELGQQVALTAATQAAAIQAAPTQAAPVADPAPVAADRPSLNPPELAVASAEPAVEASPAAEAPASPGPAVAAAAEPIEPTPELQALGVTQVTAPPVKAAEETAQPVETAEATAHPAAEAASPLPAVEPEAPPPHGLAAEAAVPGPAGPAIRAPILAITAQAIQPRTPPALAEGMARRGRAMLEWGDVSGARLLLERAADAGSGPAALALGTTYDVATLERIGAVGIQPDPDQAAYWFGLALGLGEERARPLLDALPRRDAAARTSP